MPSGRGDRAGYTSVRDFSFVDPYLNSAHHIFLARCIDWVQQVDARMNLPVLIAEVALALYCTATIHAIVQKWKPLFARLITSGTTDSRRASCGKGMVDWMHCLG